MKPTNELRFVEREINQQISKVPDKWERKTVKILQQKWQKFIHGYAEDTVIEEWCDVPCVKETA